MRQRGFQLVELVVALAIAATVLTLAAPDLFRLTARLRVDLAAHELVGTLRLARTLAIRHATRVAVKLRPDGAGRVTFAIYRDGDGDGVRNADIDSGVDPQLVPPRLLQHLGRHVRFGFPEGPAPRDPGDPRRRLRRLDDPIRFNRSNLASFNPIGGSTPGSLYLTDGRHHLVVVRLLGHTGRVRILRYDRRSERWR